MLTLRLERLAVGSKGIEDFFGLCSGDARQEGFDFFEARAIRACQGTGSVS